MAIEFKLPELGENVSAGTIAKILVKVGDTVSKDQSILEVETDKAVAEIPCPAAGKVTAIKVKEGQKVKAGDVILLIEAGAAGELEAPKAEAPAPKAAAVAAPAERPAPKLQVLERPAPAPAPAPAAVPAAPAAARTGGPVLASPSVRRMAREHGVDLATVPVADPSGRVTAQDILAFVSGGAAPAPAPAATPAAAPAPAAAAVTGDGDKWGALVLEPMSGIRKKTAERMAQNWATIPHVTHFEKADVTAIEALRAKHAKKFDAMGAKLTVTSFLIKVLGEALKRFPKFNASIDLAGEQIVYKQYYNVGVAVDTPNGLLVPVMRHVDRMSISQISIELPLLAAKARDRKLALDDMQGGTFTISNLGGVGGNAFTPIINAPEVAILGVSRSSVEPVWQNGQFAPRTMLPLSLSYDHRVIDGADAARFARWVVEALENPWVLFLED
jgi:pyruvate dehydrogenase E2 component (dihydrolipoamide acetyltransferase)